MQDAPHPDTLLAAVQAFLRQDAAPALAAGGQPALAYQARVAANMLAIVQRQWAQAAPAGAAERARLQALLDAPPDTPLDALNRQLADALAAGTLDPTRPDVAAHLWATTLDKLAVDQPGYDTFVRHQAPPEPGA